MDFFGILTMLGGLALFLYGMSTMGDGLASVSGGRLEVILEKLTSRKWRAVLLGALVTAIIQSSSATTVMVVGFVNSGIMQLNQAVGIIMGANVGTTITSWLLSLTGISGSSFFIRLLKPSSFSPILALIGVILAMTAKNDSKKKSIGNILIGFAILMFGMETMSDAVKPLADNEKFCSILTMFSNPVLGMIAGALLTAAIQSSSASVGILQALCISGAVGYGTAIPIIMGQNIGTCVTALLSSVGAKKNARRASMIHLYFNLLGTMVFMVVFYTMNSFVHFEFLDAPASAMGVAVIHSVFNIGCAILMYPLSGVLVKLSMISVPDREKENEGNTLSLPQEFEALDERFLSQPAFACELTKDAARTIAVTARDCIFLAFELLDEYDEKRAGRVRELEDRIDKFEDILGSYLVKLSAKNLSNEDSRSLSIILHCISDLERISDHAVNLCDSLEEMRSQKQAFSPKAKKELMVLVHAVQDIVELTCNAFITNDLRKATNVEPLEEVIDSLNMKLRQRHIDRLRVGKCTIELGIALEDIITNLERVSDHCSNIAVCMIQVSSGGFDTHEYVNVDIKQSKWFYDEVKRYSEIYTLEEKTDIYMDSDNNK
ncbi:MAG: Na/Pi cotransporter family protein [Lachnospiraceae bacterium]